MINTVYRLVAPRRFEIAFEDINLFGENAIVRPTYLSICNADMRYYLGTRDAKVLAEKLPMALIHEGVGEVFLDPTGTFKTGDKVKEITARLEQGIQAIFDSDRYKEFLTAMLFTYPVAGASDSVIALLVGMILFVVNEANRVENQVIMQMVFIDVGCQNKLILAA